MLSAPVATPGEKIIIGATMRICRKIWFLCMQDFFSMTQRETKYLTSGELEVFLVAIQNQTQKTVIHTLQLARPHIG